MTALTAGVIGMGGEMYVAALRQCGVDVRWLCGPHTQQVTDAAKSLEIETVTQRLDDLLSADCVVLANPPQPPKTLLQMFSDQIVIWDRSSVQPHTSINTSYASPYVFVSYPFSFLSVAQQALKILPRVGNLLSCFITTHVPPSEPRKLRKQLLQHVSDPLAWALQLFGPAVPVHESLRDSTLQIELKTRTSIPLYVKLSTGNVDAFRHELSIHGSSGTLALTLSYTLNGGWSFDPILINDTPIPLDPHAGAPTWEKAHTTVVHKILGATADPQSRQSVLDEGIYDLNKALWVYQALA